MRLSCFKDKIVTLCFYIFPCYCFSYLYHTYFVPNPFPLPTELNRVKHPNSLVLKIKLLHSAFTYSLSITFRSFITRISFRTPFNLPTELNRAKHQTLLFLPYKHWAFLSRCSTGGCVFHPPSITPLCLKLDCSNFVQSYTEIG